jgi:hypothetical protein
MSQPHQPIQDEQKGQTPLEITIDGEFQTLIAPLTPQEFDLLEVQVKKQGCLQPILVWKTPEGPRILLDGHNRYRICIDNNIDYNTRNVALASREHAKLWVLEHQAGRRNLTDDQRTIVWNEIREQRSKVAREEGAAKARAAKADSVKSAETAQSKRDTRAEVAKAAKLSCGKVSARHSGSSSRRHSISVQDLSNVRAS